MESRWVPLPECARRLAVGWHAIYFAALRGEVRATKRRGTRWYVREDDAAAFAERLVAKHTKKSAGHRGADTPRR